MSANHVVGADFILRDFVESDIDERYLSWLNDKKLMQYSNQRFARHDFKSSRDYLRSMRRLDNLFLAVVLTEDMYLVGTVAAHINRHHGTANLGILIGDEGVRGTGLAKRVWRASMVYLFDQLNMRKVCAGTLESNEPMNKIAISTGMEHEGTLIAQELINGIPVNMNLYAKFRKLEIQYLDSGHGLTA